MVHPNVAGKSDQYDDVVSQLFSASEVAFTFLGAAELLALARRRPDTTATIRISESIAISERANVNLIPLSKSYKMLDDGSRHLRRDLFESNVRDSRALCCG